MRSFNSNTIVNIVRAEITTEENTPRVFGFDTVTSAEPEPVISEGEESELRVRNTILAQDLLEDIVKGYDITLKDCVLNAGLLEIIDGGAQHTADTSLLSGYSAPQAGTPSGRTRFTLRLYAEEKDYGGQTIGVFRFSFPNCVGTPAKFQLENGSFTTPEYLVRSRPRSGEYAMTLECLDRLPVYCSSEDDVTDRPEEGDCITALGYLSVGSLIVNPGRTAYFDGENWVLID